MKDIIGWIFAIPMILIGGAVAIGVLIFALILDLLPLMLAIAGGLLIYNWVVG